MPKITSLFRKIINKAKLSRTYRVVSYYLSRLNYKFDKDHVWVLSSAVAFNFILCIIPFVLIFITVLGIYLDKSNALEQLTDYLNKTLPLPDEYKEKLVSLILSRVKEISTNTFLTGAIGFGALIWTMSGLFGTMRDVINRIYNIEETLNFLIGKIKDFALVIFSFILFIISFSLTSGFQVLKAYSVKIFGEELTFNFIETVAPFLVSFIVSFILFYILYVNVPHGKFPKKAMAIAAVVSSVLFEILKYFFTLYLVKFSNVGKIYGAFTVFVVTLFWVYYVSVIFVIGAEIGNIYVIKNKLKVILPKSMRRKENGTKKIIQND